MKDTTTSLAANIQRFMPSIAIFKLRNLSFIMVLVATSNIVTNTFFNPSIQKYFNQKKIGNMYLMDKASIYISDIFVFENKVRKIAHELEVPPEWIMAVIYSESRFDASAMNLKGSGAVGLIQFMPATAHELKTSTSDLSKYSAIEQLDYVKLYLEKIKLKYGNFESLTELYLAILFPKALEGDNCFMLYGKPSISYKQNSGLDENKDGIVTVSDIDKRMQRIFPSAYVKQYIQNEKINTTIF